MKKHVMSTDQIRLEYNLKQKQIRETKSPDERETLREQIRSLEDEYKKQTGMRIPPSKRKPAEQQGSHLTVQGSGVLHVSTQRG